MNFKKVITTFGILGFSTILFSYDFQAKSKTIKPSNPIKVGVTVDGKFVSSFEPEPVVGLKYTFYSYATGGNYNMPPKEETTEVIKIFKGYATLLVSGTFKEETEKFVKLSDIRSSGVMYVNFRYDGLFDIKVPLKSFKKATRVSVSNKTNELTLWLVKGIGVVKLIEKDKTSKAVITTELIAFRNGKNNMWKSEKG